jgi:Protein of unknown function (DUF3995)
VLVFEFDDGGPGRVMLVRLAGELSASNAPLAASARKPAATMSQVLAGGDLMIRAMPLARGAAYGAAAAAFGYAAVSLYWAAGGTAGLSTVGGIAQTMARTGGAAAAAGIAAIVLLKTAGGLLALAMVMPWGRRLPRRAVSMAGLAGSALLIVYGAVEVAGEALAETGIIRPSTPDWAALRWHLALWDPWFLVWGLLLAAATWGYRRSARQVTKPAI